MSSLAQRSTANKRLAKNTILLYMRMILILGVTLYTSRIILQVLGTIDFGVYNVVGGVVAMFSFINSSLSGASSRFITYALGDKAQDIQTTFNTIVSVHYLFAGILFLLAETVGLWFVMTKLVIPDNRLMAAFWVYQSTIASAVITVGSAPYNALIIAHERMDVFAYISIFETFAKLSICGLLLILPFDKLIIYALGVVLVQIAVRLLYMRYCHKEFEESHAKLQWNKNQAKEVFSYAGWVLNGELAAVGYTQGINILLNIFFGPLVNAARGISVQVQNAITLFAKNFLSAVRPQVIKSYANRDFRRMHQLVLVSSRLGVYLMLLISLPIIFKTPYLLDLWLTEVPPDTTAFVRIMLICGIVNALATSTIIAIQATGDIRKFQIIEGSILLLIVPLAYIMLKFTAASAEDIFWMYLLVQCITQLVRVWLVYPKIGLTIRNFYAKVLWPIVKVAICACSLSYGLHLWLNDAKLIQVLLFGISSVIGTAVAVLLFGLNMAERRTIKQYISNIILHKRG